MALQHAAPGDVVNLRPLGDRLREIRTHAIAKTVSFEAVRLVVPAGRTIAEHKVAGPIMLHCLEGRVELGLAGNVLSLGAGDWTYLEPGEKHSVRGIDDSSLLLTILFSDERG